MHTQGYVHVYTGDGKGKTTATLGMALRAMGAGWRVFFAQLAKGLTSGELAAMESLSRFITVRQFGHPSFIDRDPGGQGPLAVRSRASWSVERPASPPTKCISRPTTRSRVHPGCAPWAHPPRW